MAILAFLVVIAIVVLTLYLVIDTANYNSFVNMPSYKGRIGESQVSSILRSLPQEYLVLDNVTIPDQAVVPSKNITTQIDHVVFSPFGIFVIETKNYSGWIFGQEKSKRWKESFQSSKGRFFYNPIKQNWGHAYALAERLQLDISVFKPIVVFSDNCELHVESTTPVVYLSQLRGLILEYTQEIIPPSIVTLIYNKLSNINLVGEETEDRHIQSIGERAAKREATIQQGKCPRCGGTLKMRSGKYGSFYGCSNYPKCRFTYNVRK